MARVIIWNLVTLDGFFEGEKKWDLDFHSRGSGAGEAQHRFRYVGESSGLRPRDL